MIQSSMEFTGERVIPGQVELDLWNEHVARYAFAVSVARRLSPKRGMLRVLDAGCGSGYGAALLASLVPRSQVTAADISPEAIGFAQAHYSAPNLDFLLADCLSLPAGLGPFGLVVTFEVIEHLPDPGGFLAAVAAMLSPPGLLVASTPNRRYYTEERGYTNPFHQREYDGGEFAALLARFFPHSRVFAQNHASAISFCPIHPGGSDRLAAAEIAAAPEAADQPHFLLAVCGPNPIPELEPFVFVPSAANVLREREQHITKLDHDLDALKEQTDRELDKRKQWAEKLEADLAARDAAIQQLQADHEQANEWARRADHMLAEARGVIGARDRVIEERGRELDTRKQWAEKLEADLAARDAAILQLQADHERANEWARRADQMLEGARGVIEARDREIEERGRELDKRKQWAEKLEADLAARDAAILQLQADHERANEWARRADQMLEGARGVIEARDHEIDERTAWTKKLEADLAARDAAILQLQADHERANEWARRADQMLEGARGVIEARDREIDERTAWAKKLEQEVQERTAWARQLDEESQRLSGIITGLQADVESKVSWAHGLKADLGGARGALAKLQQEFDERTAWAHGLEADLGGAREALAKLQKEFDERAAWALRLDGELRAAREELERRAAALEAAAADLRLILGSLWYRAGKKLRLSPVPACDRNRPAPPSGTIQAPSGDEKRSTEERVAAATSASPGAPVEKDASAPHPDGSEAK